MHLPEGVSFQKSRSDIVVYDNKGELLRKQAKCVCVRVHVFVYIYMINMEGIRRGEVEKEPETEWRVSDALSNSSHYHKNYVIIINIIMSIMIVIVIILTD